MSKKRFIVKFRYDSGSDERFTPDGEIAGWLSPQKSANGGASSGSSSGSSGSSGSSKPQTVIEGRQGKILATIPAGDRLLCVHTPPAAGAVTNYIILHTDGKIMVLPGGLLSSRTTLGSWSEGTFGRLIKAIPYRDTVTLLGSKRMVWLVRDPDTGVYTLRTALPAAPDCELGLSPAILPPYVNAEGETPLISVRVAIGEERATKEGVQSWIDAGSVRGVDESIRANVSHAVAEAVADYLSAVSEAGLVTAPVEGLATWSRRLPGEVQRAGTYTRPTIRIEGWSYLEGVLRMNLRLSAPPSRPRAIVTVGLDNVMWADIFPRMEIFLSEQPKWWESSEGSGVSVGSLTDVTIDGTRQRGFALFALTAEEYYARLKGARYFRPAGDLSASSRLTGITLLRRDPKGETLYPDYTDHEPLAAAGGTATDEGPVIFADNRVMSVHPDFPVLYPCRKSIGDAPILALTRSFRRRAAVKGGRTPLTLFSADGVRLISSDGAGGYGLSQLLSRDILLSPEAVAVGDTSCIFLTDRGLVEINSTKRSVIAEDMPGNGSVNAGNRLSYSYSGDFLLLTSSEGRYLYDRKSATWGELTSQAGDPTEIGAELCAVDEHGHVVSIGIVRKEVDAESGEGSTGDTTSGATGSEVGEDVLPPLPDPIVTRALKFGSWHTRKRIARILLGTGEASWRLEGSDDASEWREMASGSDDRSPRLRLPAARFWRIAISAPKETIYSLCFDVEIVDFL